MSPVSQKFYKKALSKFFPNGLIVTLYSSRAFDNELRFISMTSLITLWPVCYNSDSPFYHFTTLSFSLVMLTLALPNKYLVPFYFDVFNLSIYIIHRMQSILIYICVWIRQVLVQKASVELVMINFKLHFSLNVNILKIKPILPLFQLILRLIK